MPQGSTPNSQKTLYTVAQKIYPLAQQALKKWEALPDEEKAQYIQEAKNRLQAAVAKLSTSATQTQTQAPTKSQSDDDGPTADKSSAS